MARLYRLLVISAIMVAPGAAGPLAAQPLLREPTAQLSQTSLAVQELSGKLLETADLIQSQEQEAIDSEARLGELKLLRHALSANFDRRRGELTDLLGALERVGRQPPAMLLARPDTAVEQVRGAMLLGAVIHSVEQEAAKLHEELARVEKLESAIAAERERIEDLLADLHTQKDHLTGLLQKKDALYTELDGDSAMAREAVAQLAERARTTRELLSALKLHQSGAAPRSKPQPGQAPGQPEEASGAAVAPEAFAALRPLPGDGLSLRNFDQARGNLQVPARGKIVADFGRPNGGGGTRRGITIRTLDSAEVVAPFEAKVVFAGQFRGYGQLLILEADGGYHILLSGMSQIHGKVGQLVTAGEPVGRMGAMQEGGASEASGAGSNSALKEMPELYVEFRKDGEPFNPVPWLAVSEKKVSG